MVIGRVREIWRYPVKSMGGERLDRSMVGTAGIPGDRGWALRDETAGEICGAKHLPKLMLCASRYREQFIGEKIPHVDITFPGGARYGSDDPEVNFRLSELLERPVSLWPLQPAGNKAHYRRANAGSFVINRMSRLRPVRAHLNNLIRYAGLDGSMRKIFDRAPDEPLPDLSAIPPELFEYTSPPGTYFDAFPLHLLTTASLAAMSRLNPKAAWDVRRFRPNFLISSEEDTQGLMESGWSGRALRIGAVRLKCEIPTVRCGMTRHAQAGLPEDTTVLRTIVREASQELGIYASIVSPGPVGVGDQVELL